MKEISLFLPKIDLHGEDSHPVCKVNADGGLLAVFDGLGGAGAREYEIEEGISRTGAYIASRVSRSVLAAYYEAKKQRNLPPEPDKDFALLGELMQEMLTAFLKSIDRKPSLLRSNLIKRLPTTLAGIWYEDTGEQLKAHAFWAGDSRAYILSPEKGLQQISRDDIVTGGDALNNLYQDSPISNCIHADGRFSIHHQTLNLQKPVMLIAASDGCFDYFTFPSHFEQFLLNTMQTADNEEEWMEIMLDGYRKIASDDVTLAIAAPGYGQFSSVKETFKKRAAHLQLKYTGPVDDFMDSFRQIGTPGESDLKRRQQFLESIWAMYKEDYEALMPKPQTVS